MLHFRILGPLEISHPSGVLRLGGRLRRKLLCLLLVNACQLVLTEVLMGEMWPEGQAARTENALQAHVSRLRQSLTAVEPDRAEWRVITHPSGYQIDVDPAELDSLVFVRDLRLAREMSRTRPDMAAQQLRETLKLWRGPALGGMTEGPLLGAAATRYQEVRLETLELLYDCELRCGNHVPVVSELRDLLARYPFQERMWQQLMVALYRSGRQADALRVYRDLWRRLSHEMGLEPTPAIREYERAILSQDPLLDTFEFPLLSRARKD